MHHKSFFSILILASVAQNVLGCSNLPSLADPTQSAAKTATINLRVNPPASWTFYVVEGFPTPAAEDQAQAQEGATDDPPTVPVPLTQFSHQKNNPQKAKDQMVADVKKYIESVLLEENLPKDWLKGTPKFVGAKDAILGGMIGSMDCGKDEIGNPLTQAGSGPDYIVNRDGNVIMKCDRKTRKKAKGGDTLVSYPIEVTLKQAISEAKWEEMANKLQSKLEQHRFAVDGEITVNLESA